MLSLHGTKPSIGVQAPNYCAVKIFRGMEVRSTFTQSRLPQTAATVVWAAFSAPDILFKAKRCLPWNWSRQYRSIQTVHHTLWSPQITRNTDPHTLRQAAVSDNRCTENHTKQPCQTTGAQNITLSGRVRQPVHRISHSAVLTTKHKAVDHNSQRFQKHNFNSK
jgi:hypothetical protein